MLYVTDRVNARIQVFDGDGNFSASAAIRARPAGSRITPDQHLWLAHGHAGRVMKLISPAMCSASWAAQGKALGQFGEAHNIVVTARDEVLVADTLNWRLQKFVRRSTVVALRQAGGLRPRQRSCAGDGVVGPCRSVGNLGKPIVTAKRWARRIGNAARRRLHVQSSTQRRAARDPRHGARFRHAGGQARHPEVEPARACDRSLPTEVLDAASQMGLRTLALSEDHGGAGADTLTSCIVAEELAVGDVDVAATLTHTSALGARPVRRADDRRAARALPAAVSWTTTVSPRLAVTRARSDEALGTNYHRAVPVAPRCDDDRRARRTAMGDQRREALRATRRSRSCSRSRSRPTGVRPGSASMILVPRETAGLTVRDAKRRGSHWHHGARGERDVQGLPRAAGNLLGEGDGARRDLLPQRAAVPAGDQSRRRPGGVRRRGRLREAPRPGRPADHRAPGDRHASSPTSRSSSRSRATRSGKRRGRPTIPTRSPIAASRACRSSSRARLHRGERCTRSPIDAAECFGAMGVMRDMPLQKYVHDALDVPALRRIGDSATKLGSRKRSRASHGRRPRRERQDTGTGDTHGFLTERRAARLADESAQVRRGGDSPDLARARPHRRADQETWDWDIIKKGSKLGFRTAAVPKEWGGHGIDFVTQALVMAELAHGDSAISKAFSQNWKWSHLIAAACTDDQKERFLKPFLADDTFVLGRAAPSPTPAPTTACRRRTPRRPASACAPSATATSGS